MNCAGGATFFVLTLFFINTPFFSHGLDVLIFGAFSASNVLIGVLNLISYKTLESWLKKVVKYINDKILNNSKKDHNISSKIFTGLRYPQQTYFAS